MKLLTVSECVFLKKCLAASNQSPDQLAIEFNLAKAVLL